MKGWKFEKSKIKRDKHVKKLLLICTWLTGWQATSKAAVADGNMFLFFSLCDVLNNRCTLKLKTFVFSTYFRIYEVCVLHETIYFTLNCQNVHVSEKFFE